MITIPDRRPCPFSIGDDVIYRPSNQGWGYEVMAPLEQRLVPGKIYKVAQINNGKYIIVEGYSHPLGGLYWTEFDPISK